MDEGSTPSSSTDMRGTGPAGLVPVFVRAVVGRRSVPAGSRGLFHCRFIRQNGLRVFPCLLPAGPAGRLSVFFVLCRRFGRRDSFGTARSEGGRLRVSSLRAVIFFRSVVFSKGRFMAFLSVSRPLSDRTGHFRNALRFSRSFRFVFGRLPRPVFLRLGRGRGGIGMRRFESAWDVFGIPIVYFPLQTFEFPMFPVSRYQAPYG